MQSEMVPKWSEMVCSGVVVLLIRMVSAGRALLVSVGWLVTPVQEGMVMVSEFVCDPGSDSRLCRWSYTTSNNLSFLAVTVVTVLNVIVY